MQSIRKSLQEIKRAICNIHKVQHPELSHSMITEPEFKGSLRPSACSLFFTVPNFFCTNGVCMPSCPPQGLGQIFLLEKLKLKQFKINCLL